MNLPTDDQSIFTEQKDFWDSLHMDILTANQNLTEEDFQAFIERSFMFSLLFRGCTALEIVGFQKIFNLKDYGYLIMLELSDVISTNIINNAIDEIALHHYIKQVLHNKNCSLSPLRNNRMCILISEDHLMLDLIHKEESIAICRKLIQSIEDHFHFRVTTGIGSMQSIQSIYSSYIDVLTSLYCNSTESVVYYHDVKRNVQDSHFDYHITQHHMSEAVRLRKVEAYDYFGLMMDYIRPFSDTAKRNKILELLMMTDHAMNIDNESELEHLDYIGFILQLMNYSGEELIEYGYQLFISVTNYVKPQISIDYSNDIVKATKEYMEAHYSDDITLEDTAAQVNISPQYFSKLIKKTTGFNFIEWLSMLRVKKAKELLNNSNLTVKEVCFMVGYKDPNYFSRIFKKRIGITPSEYVKANSHLNSMS